MRDRGLILAGLCGFLVLITFPFWHNLLAETTSRAPELKLPAKEKDCVAPVNYMRASHMKLLIDWRNSVVRENQWKYVAFDGKVYDMKLAGTCLKCHEKRDFCDRCHTYAGVGTPDCFECHVDPALVQRSAR
jgi:hypothetical protein